MHAILDQMKKYLLPEFTVENGHIIATRGPVEEDICIDHTEFRRIIANRLPEYIENGHINWDIPKRGPVKEWVKTYSQVGAYVGQEFLQLASIYLNRKIILYPVNPVANENDQEANRNVNKIEIFPHEDCNCGIESTNHEPITLLYYEETNFVTPHFQSIRPIPLPPQAQITQAFSTMPSPSLETPPQTDNV